MSLIRCTSRSSEEIVKGQFLNWPAQHTGTKKLSQAENNVTSRTPKDEPAFIRDIVAKLN